MPSVTMKPCFRRFCRLAAQVCGKTSTLRTSWSAAKTATTASLASRRGQFAGHGHCARGITTLRLEHDLALDADLGHLFLHQEAIVVIGDDRRRVEYFRVKPEQSVLEVESFPSSGMNCFGMVSREPARVGVPAPPHMITGIILPIRPSSRTECGSWGPARHSWLHHTGRL